MNSNGITEEPSGLMLTRREVEKWLGLGRDKLEAIASSHPEIVYQPHRGAMRLFRKSKIKSLLLGE